MALHFELKVNDQVIGYFHAQRLSGGMDAESVNPYRVDMYEGNPAQPDTVSRVWSGTITHRYGAGAWALVRAAIERLGADRNIGD